MKRAIKNLVVLTTAAAMISGLSACGGDGKSGESAGTSKESSAGTESQAEVSDKEKVSGKVVMVTNAIQYDTVIDKFKEDYPEIELVWDQQAGGNLADVYKTRLSAGADGIDVFAPARADYPVLAESGHLLDITGRDYLENFTSGVVDSATVGGKVYGIPMTAQTYLVWYNKEMFDKYQLEEPQTMEELEQVCEVLKENGEVPFATFGKSDQLHVFIALLYNDLLSNDTEWLNKLETGEAKWTDEESLKAIRKFSDWVDKGYILDGSLSLDDTQAYQAFYQGKAAMLPNGAWSIDKIAEAAPDFAVGAFAYVSNAGTENKAQYVNGTIMAAAAESGNVEAAETFMSWIAQPENAQLWCNEAKQFGTVKGVTSDFHPAAKQVSPIYEMDKTPMFHAFLSQNAKTVVYVEFQKLMAQSETGATPEQVAEAIQAAQDKDVAAKK